MSNLTRRPDGAAGTAVTIPTANPVEPVLPVEVNQALEVLANPIVGKGTLGPHDPGYRQAPVLLSLNGWRVAQDEADRLDDLLDDRIGLDQLAAWLAPLNAAIRNPQPPEAFQARIRGLIVMLDDLPACLFNAATRRAIDADGFFPSHTDIRRVIGPIAEGWATRRDALRRLRRAPDRAQQPVARERIGHGENLGRVAERLAGDVIALKRDGGTA
jgi:hypothetical protein